MMKINKSRKANFIKVRTALGLLLLACTFVPPMTVNAELVEDNTVETEGEPNIQDNNDNDNNNGNEQDGNANVDNGNGGEEGETKPAPIPEPSIDDPMNPGYDPKTDPDIDPEHPVIKPVVDEYSIKRGIPKTGANQLVDFSLIGTGLGVAGFGIYKVIESKLVYKKKKNKTKVLTKKNNENK